MEGHAPLCQPEQLASAQRPHHAGHHMKSVLLSLPFFSSLCSLNSGSLGSLVPPKPSFLPREWSSSMVSPHSGLQCLDDSQNVLIQFEYLSILYMSKDLSVSFRISRFVFFKYAFQIFPNDSPYLISTYCNVPFQIKFYQIGSYLPFGWFG